MDPKSKALATIPQGQGTDLANLNMQQILFVGELMFNAGMFTDVKSLATAQVKVMAGQELGLTPFQAMNSFHIIHGRATMAANLMASKIKGSGKYDYRVVVLDDTICHIDVYELQPKREKIGESRFSIEDAKKASTQNIGKFTRNMLFARAISNAAKWYCPDVFGGQPVYVPGEIEDDPTPVNDAGESIEDIEARREAEKQSRREYAAKAGARRTEAKVAAQKTKATEPTLDAEEQEAVNDYESGEMVSAPDPEARKAELQEAARNTLTPKAEPDALPTDEDVAAIDGSEAFDKALEEAIPFDAHTLPQRRQIMAILNEFGFKTDAEKHAVFKGLTDLTSFKELSMQAAVDLINTLQMSDPEYLRETYVEGNNGST